MKTPPLLIGIAILFWGYEVRQLVLAAFMAAAVEASRWIKHRWDFSETDFKKVSVFCSLVLFSIGFYRFLTGWTNHSAWMIFNWLPVVLLPLFLTQLYSSSGCINLNVLYLFRKNKIQNSQRKARYIDLSFIYLASCIFATGFINNRNGLFYVGMLGLVGWLLWSYRSRQYSAGLWIVLMLVAGGVGYLGQKGLSKLQTIVEQKAIHWYIKPGESPYRKYTQIGDIQEDKLSNRIIFRAQTGGIDQRSLLLREATYDTFRSNPSMWSISRKHFKRIKSNPDHSSWYLADGTGDTRICTIAQYLRGQDTLLKLPNGAFQIDSLSVSIAEKNPYGAVKVNGDGLMTYRTRYGVGSPLISPPESRDLQIPELELTAIQGIADQLNLQSLPPSEILKKVKRHFKTQFTYSLKHISRRRHSSPIANFLTNTRSGHCEYFATATVLLLRHAGIPARYSRGYAVDPSDKIGGWSLVRERYAHAWAVAYIDNAWVNLDTTPSTWLEIERQQQPHWQRYWRRIKDKVSDVMFRLTRWRQKIQIAPYVKYIVPFLLPLLLWRGWRKFAPLFKRWRTRRTAVAKKPMDLSRTGLDSAFYRVEQRLNDFGLTRYPWETFSAWLNRIEPSASRTISLDIPRKSLALHYRYRFDPRGLSPSEKSRMTSMISAWLAENHHLLGTPQKRPDL